ncbi:uncharacterized protein VTP21DRAFT_10236 [Calcarisporiella thermophila]|uniref:uncharacterized protein n=1 Tax=Calcarisporiella thermophila TaxID=911321 RepID=UPI003742FA2D
MIVTPSVLQLFKPEEVPNLQVVTLCGEPLPETLAETWLPHITLINGYGPTETIIVTSVQPLKLGGRINVGRPFNNVSYYVLDRDLRMVPTGVVGELYISGLCVAKGYVNRPETTAELFIENPFKPGTIMYKSGDMARWNLDGQMEIIGRADDQVKLKGYRIELGEVTSTMGSYPAVGSAIALVKDKTLTGFVTPANVDTEALRDWLFDFLPEYMVPATIVALEKFPMTSNGKIDKAKLKSSSLQTSESRQLPVNEKQKLVISIMSSILNVDVDQIDLNTSFFALGGDSISAIALVSAFRRNGLHLTVPQLFKATTPARLAAIAQEISDKPAYSSDFVISSLQPVRPRIYVRSQQAYRV